METKFTIYQLPLFFLLAYLLSWWAMLPLHGLFAQGVAIAAVIVIALAMGRTGLREWWGRLKNFRAGWLYLVGPLFVAGYYLTAMVINLLLGATVVNLPQFPSKMVVGELVLLGGWWEELGWSGYALPTLQKRFAKTQNGALIATLIVGGFRAIWHLPLVVFDDRPWYAAIYSLAFQVIISWLYNKSGGSVPAVMFFHLIANILSIVVSPVFAGADKTMYMILYYTCAGLIALVLAWSSKFKLEWRGTETSLSEKGVA